MLTDSQTRKREESVSQETGTKRSLHTCTAQQSKHSRGGVQQQTTKVRKLASREHKRREGIEEEVKEFAHETRLSIGKERERERDRKRGTRESREITE